MLLIDDYTRMTWVTFLKEKSEAFEKFKIFKAMVENKTNQKINVLDRTMGESLPQTSSMNFVIYMGSKDNFQLQRLHSRMVLLKGRIEQSKKLPEQCLMKKNYHIIF